MTKDEQIKKILNDFKPERADEFVEKIKSLFRQKPREDQEIIDAIEMFRPLNKMIDASFRNITERKSATSLLNKLGKIKLEKYIVYINGHKNELYFPSITKPSELIGKWEKLQKWWREHKNDKVVKEENDSDYLKRKTMEWKLRNNIK